MSDNSLNNPEIERLSLEIKRLELEQKRREIEASTKQPQKAWWASAVEFLALPAAVFAIVTQLTGTVGTVHETEKTQAETQKILTEEVKTRAELESILEELAEKKKKGVESYRAEVEKTLPQLEETLKRLRSINAQSDKALLQWVLPKYIMLWILFHAVGLVFDVIQSAWSALLTSTALAVFNRKTNKKFNRLQEERWEKIRRVTQWGVAIAAPVPNILRWSIQLSIFVALMIPLFNETAYLLGSSMTFDDLIKSAKHLDLSGALIQMKELIFRGQG